MKRQLRSDTAAESANSSMPKAQPPAKKKKAEPVRYLCYSCDTERVASTFPDYNPSADCDHLIHTCKLCLKQWVQAQIEANIFKTGGEDGKAWGVACPECPAIMRNVNVEIAATKKVYQRFEELERNHIAESTPGWRWCLKPGCKAGQVHESKPVMLPPSEKENEESSPKKKSKAKSKKKKADTKEDEVPEVVDICTCHECGAKACVPCERPWHEGETCEQYKARVQDRFDEEDKALREIEKVSRPCPSCSKNIQKNGGCSNMFCSACQTSFCWNCMSEYYNSYYCKCRPAPPPAPVLARPGHETGEGFS